MAGDHIEVEAKFYLRHLADVRQRVLDAGGRLTSPRHLERNERYDTHDGRLTASGEVLRLRIAEGMMLTYKGVRTEPEERREIEVEVADSAAARALLAALGYRIVVVYEKYREVFGLEDCQVMLDELPFGCFVEIEGSSRASIQATARRLHLDWGRRVSSSYVQLFEDLRRRRHLTITNAAFEDFVALPPISAEDLGLLDSVQPA